MVPTRSVSRRAASATATAARRWGGRGWPAPGKRGVQLLLVEGGGVLHGSFFDQRLVDKVHAVIAPMVIGAAKAPAAVAGRGAARTAAGARVRGITEERPGGG